MKKIQILKEIKNKAELLYSESEPRYDHIPEWGILHLEELVKQLRKPVTDSIDKPSDIKKLVVDTIIKDMEDNGPMTQKLRQLNRGGYLQ